MILRSVKLRRGGARRVTIRTASAYGSISLGGTAAARVIQRVYASTSGSILLGGTAAATSQRAPVLASASGSILTSGSARALLSLRARASGAIVLGGSAHALLSLRAQASGSIVLGGSARVDSGGVTEVIEYFGSANGGIQNASDLQAAGWNYFLSSISATADYMAGFYSASTVGWIQKQIPANAISISVTYAAGLGAAFLTLDGVEVDRTTSIEPTIYTQAVDGGEVLRIGEAVHAGSNGIFHIYSVTYTLTES